MRDEDRYLQQRKSRWYYKRRVPADLQKHYQQNIIRRKLGTDEIDLARARRDKHERADDEYWTLLRMEGEASDTAQRRYETAVRRATAWNYDYVPASELAKPDNLEELLKRIEDLSSGQVTKQEVDALLGRVDEPALYLDDVFKVVQETVEAHNLATMDSEGRKTWIRQRQASIDLFNKLNDSPPVDAIDRKMARGYYDHWNRRVLGDTEYGRKISGNHAGTQLGHIRKMLNDYFKYMGIDYENPFKDLSFDNRQKSTKEPFTVKQIQKVFLTPGGLSGIHKEIRLISYLLVETGARMAELLTLDGEDIILDHEIPHLKIFKRSERNVKNFNSERNIPLVGVSLAAAKLVKDADGFPHYRERRNTFSGTTNKIFRSRNLFAKGQSIGSLRHSFEDRLKEAQVDKEMRAYLVGHEIDREIYGKFGSLKLKQDAIKSIELPFDPALLEDIS